LEVNIPSAKGDRQIFPKQTIKILTDINESTDVKKISNPLEATEYKVL
jgi:hypothetical protein